MSGFVLLIIGLASLALVFAGFAFLGHRAWRLLKRGMAMTNSAAQAARLADKAAGLAVKADTLAANTESIAANVEHLNATMARLEILTLAWNEAMQPVRRARHYLGHYYVDP